MQLVWRPEQVCFEELLKGVVSFRLVGRTLHGIGPGTIMLWIPLERPECLIRVLLVVHRGQTIPPSMSPDWLLL